MVNRLALITWVNLVIIAPLQGCLTLAILSHQRAKGAPKRATRQTLIDFRGAGITKYSAIFFTCIFKIYIALRKCVDYMHLYPTPPPPPPLH